MGCYTVPLTAAIIHFFMKRKKPNMNTKYNTWLSHLLIGGATFGVIDHLWNGELLFNGEGLLLDLLLGVAITVGIFLIWAGMIMYDKQKLSQSIKASN